MSILRKMIKDSVGKITFQRAETVRLGNHYRLMKLGQEPKHKE